MTHDYRKDEVYLINFGTQPHLVVIKDVMENAVRHDFGWDTIESFKARNPFYYGRREYFFFGLFYYTIATDSRG